jgi:hypothetical protein
MLMRLLPYFLALLTTVTAAGQQSNVRFTLLLSSWDKQNDSASFSVNALDTAHTSAAIQSSCGKDGKCRVSLPLDHVYRLEMTGTGHVSKYVLLDLNGPTIKDRKWGYRMRITVKLMPELKGVDYSICERPLGLSHFDHKDNQFVWDERYSAELEPYYEAMQNQYLDVKAKEKARP